MPKIKFITETLADGEIRYYTTIDGSYVASSLRFNFEKARVIYNQIVKTGSPMETTILATTEKESSELTLKEKNLIYKILGDEFNYPDTFEEKSRMLISILEKCGIEKGLTDEMKEDVEYQSNLKND